MAACIWAIVISLRSPGAAAAGRTLSPVSAAAPATPAPSFRTSRRLSSEDVSSGIELPSQWTLQGVAGAHGSGPRHRSIGGNGRWTSTDAGSSDPSHLKAINLLPELIGTRPTDQSESSLIRASPPLPGLRSRQLRRSRHLETLR